jgi:hypothetical protein
MVANMMNLAGIGGTGPLIAHCLAVGVGKDPAEIGLLRRYAS